MNKRIKEAAALTALNVFFIVVCFITLIPILYAVSVSLSGGGSLLSSDFSFIPKDLSLTNYKEVLFGEDIALWLKNTVLLAVSTVSLSLVFAVPAAYCFSRRSFAGRKFVLKCLVLLNSFPAILSMFAIYRLLRPLGLVNSRAGLILVYTGTMAVFSLWNTKGYFDTIPVEIEEAARMDGANDMQVVMKIVLPLAKPSIITTALQVLIYVWNEYIYATTFMTGESKYTLDAMAVKDITKVSFTLVKIISTLPTWASSQSARVLAMLDRSPT